MKLKKKSQQVDRIQQSYEGTLLNALKKKNLSNEIKARYVSVEFFERAKKFLRCRQQMLKLWKSTLAHEIESKSSFDRIIKFVPPAVEAFDPNFRQLSLAGGVANTIDELYCTAEVCRMHFKSVIEGVIKAAGLDGSVFSLANLKCQVRAAEKAEDDYKNREPGPPISWLFDVVRGMVVCETEIQISLLVSKLLELGGISKNLLEDVHYEVIRLKNRFPRKFLLASA